MNETKAGALLLASVLALAAASHADSRLTENTLRLDEGQASPPATLESVAFLAGSWVGEGLGGEVEEVWAAPSGGSMVGAFKLLRDGEPSFYEILLVLEEEGSLVLRLKHFDPDLTGWEEKDDFVSFPLVKMGKNEAWFRGLTYRLVEDELHIFLALRTKEGRKEV
ncbi:MAG: DUF6265 family protein, partial [Thermoanaerobaculia bacterium]|nr:DUF6265 family protein [Thermoanaerobaculia bacterium]